MYPLCWHMIAKSSSTSGLGQSPCCLLIAHLSICKHRCWRTFPITCADCLQSLPGGIVTKSPVPNGPCGSKNRRWLSCPLPQRKRSRRRGKCAGVIARLKAHLRVSSSAALRLGSSPPARFICSRWIRSVFPEPAPLITPVDGPAKLAQLKAGSSRRKFIYIQPPDAGSISPAWSAALPVALRTRH